MAKNVDKLRFSKIAFLYQRDVFMDRKVCPAVTTLYLLVSSLAPLSRRGLGQSEQKRPKYSGIPRQMSLIRLKVRWGKTSSAPAPNRGKQKGLPIRLI